MPDLRDGESVEIKGSAAKPYILKNGAGVYSCSCPAWRNQSLGIEQRSCKHLAQYRGEQAEQQRVGQTMPAPSRPATSKPKPIAPALLLAETWSPDADVKGWWLSEKLDGVRAYWDGSQFVSRQGNRFYAPDWFTAGLPNLPLDGELWLGRKAFQRTVSIVRRQDESELWRELKFRVFDAPAANGPFEERIEYLCDCFSKLRLRYAGVLPQMRCRGIDHLQEELDRIVSLRGEGLMLRQPGSRYEGGRSATLLKAKRFHDAEACVTGHQPGSGRHKGRLGALAVVLPDGTEFSVGTGFSDAQREQPPAVGSIITFRYQELTDRGVPRFPSFVRVRQDIEQPAARITACYPVPSNNPFYWRASMIRHFEFVGGNSAKFWEVNILGATVTVRYGRLGTQGQTKNTGFTDAGTAQKYANALIAQKIRKGYQETAAV